MTDYIGSRSPDAPRSDDHDPVAAGCRILAEAVEAFRPVKVYALFSGGHDSLCSTHLVSNTQRFDGCVHINTGIGIEETRDFVRETCRKHGWPLRESRPAGGFRGRPVTRSSTTG